jgi:membrane protein YqaA with SNARE-associated domain
VDLDVLARMGPAAVLLVALLYGVLSATVPLFNTEVFIVAASFAAADSLRAPLVAAITVGTLLGKAGVYEGADHLVARVPPRTRAKLDRATDRLRRHRALTWPVVFASALVGVPPFYPVTVASGALRLGLVTYLVVTAVGRVIRFGAIMYAPDLWRLANGSELLQALVGRGSA